MSAPFVVRRACELTSLSLVLDVVSSMWLDPASGIARLGAGMAFLNALVYAGLLWKVAAGSSAARFTFSASVVVSALWSTLSVTPAPASLALTLTIVALQVAAVWLLYGERAGTWFARQRLLEHRDS